MDNPCYIRRVKPPKPILMKNMSRITIALTFLLTSFFANAQLTVAEPEFANTIVYVGKTPGSIELERQKLLSKSTVSTSVYILGVGKVKSISYVESEKSTIRITNTDTLQFIIRVKDNSLNPAEAIRLSKFSVNQKKKIRFIEVASTGTFSGGQEGGPETVKFEAIKYGSNSYMLTVRNLPLGEYFFTLLDAGENVQMFGVD